MMHEIQDFTPVPPDRWQRLKAAVLARSGLDINDDKGTAEAHGVKISYDYDPITTTLSLQTLDKPWFLAEEVIDQKVHDFVENTR